MQKVFSLALVLAVCLSLFGCGGNAPKETAAATTAAPQPVAAESGLMYEPGITVMTDFGTVTILDAAFCAKAQLIDGLPKPAYQSAGDGRFVFAMRALIENTSQTDLILFDDLKISIVYGDTQVSGCSKGGNYKSSDPLYTVLPAGQSGEYILCGRIPVEQFRSATGFQVSFNDAVLSFSHDSIHIYNTMGYQEGENLLTSIENILACAGAAPAETQASAEEAVPGLSFSLEDVRFTQTEKGLTVEVKIRNNSESHLPSVVFNGTVLDSSGDILENCSLFFQNGLEPGQAGWTDLTLREENTLAHMASLKFITAWYKTDPQAPSHNLRYDLPEPFMIELP